MSRLTQRALVLGLALALTAPGVAALTGCAGAGVPEPKGVAQTTTEVSVYFSTGRSLIEETRLVNANDKYGDTLAKLMAANPETHSGVAIVQPTSKINKVTFDKGTGVVTVDWNKDVLKFDAEPGEKTLAWAAFLETLGQFPEVRKVAFTVDGKTSGTVDGKSIEGFWTRISLKGSPWPVLRPPGFSDPASATPSATSTAAPKKK